MIPSAAATRESDATSCLQRNGGTATARVGFQVWSDGVTMSAGRTMPGAAARRLSSRGGAPWAPPCARGRAAAPSAARTARCRRGATRGASGGCGRGRCACLRQGLQRFQGSGLRARVSRVLQSYARSSGTLAAAHPQGHTTQGSLEDLRQDVRMTWPTTCCTSTEAQQVMFATS